VGDLLLTAGGEWRRVVAISPTPTEATVYNFQVEDNHDFFVGESGLLVHNAGACNIGDDSEAYDKYWDDLGKPKSPSESAPYDMRNRYDTGTGELKSVTTYDEYGRRAYRYEIQDDTRHGPGYHIYGDSPAFPSYDLYKHVPFDFFD